MRVWKLILLNAVTLGVYQFFWFIGRRRELMKVTGSKIPHIAWLFAPAIFAVAVLTSAIVGLAAYSGATGQQGTTGYFTALISLFFLLVTVSVIITAWWVWRFSQAVEQATKGRITAAWSLAYWLLIGSVMIYLQQYYINRGPYSTEKGPSQRFVLWSTVLLGLMLLYSISSTVNIPSNIERARQQLRETESRQLTPGER